MRGKDGGFERGMGLSTKSRVCIGICNGCVTKLTSKLCALGNENTVRDFDFVWRLDGL